jgi:alkyl hydroperoxide reductase subunit F
MRDLIIIGGGPAGCSAGIYAGRKKLDTLLIAKDFTGQIALSSWVENYPGVKRTKGIDLAKSFVEHVKVQDIDIKSHESVLNIKKQEDSFLVITDESEYQTKALIIASGATPKRLTVKNEEKYIGKGISYCVTCDANAFEGKDVAVVGGGNAGLEAALELTRFAKNVFLLEILDELTADGVLIDEVKSNENIEIITSASIQGFEGDGDLEEITYINLKDGKDKKLFVNGCFVEIGTIPNTEFLKGVVDLNELGEVIINPRNLSTSVKGIYAAGDVTDFRDKQVVIAAGQGAVVALEVFRNILKS